MSGMARSPIFIAKRTRRSVWPEGWKRMPISVRAFFLALVLVTAMAAMAGGVLLSAMPARQASLPFVGSPDSRAERRSPENKILSQGRDGSGREMTKKYYGHGIKSSSE